VEAKQDQGKELTLEPLGGMVAESYDSG